MSFFDTRVDAERTGFNVYLGFRGDFVRLFNSNFNEEYRCLFRKHRYLPKYDDTYIQHGLADEKFEYELFKRSQNLNLKHIEEGTKLLKGSEHNISS